MIHGQDDGAETDPRSNWKVSQGLDLCQWFTWPGIGMAAVQLQSGSDERPALCLTSFPA